MEQSRNTSQSFIISISLAAIIFLIMGAYIAYTHEDTTDEEQLPGTFLRVQEETRTPRQLRDVTATKKPTILAKPTIRAGEVLIRPRETIIAEPPRATAATALKFPDFAVQRDAWIAPVAPKVQVICELAASTASKEEMGYSVRAAQSSMRSRYASIEHSTMCSFTMTVSLTDSVPTDVALAISIGKAPPIKPLPKGEPGGRVVGRGKDIRGLYRLVRIQHDLADWWADQSSLVALAQWLNTQTKIKTDMCVEGGAIRLTDPKLSKAPLVFFTGHDPNHVRSRNLARGAPLRTTMSQQEKDGLRKYLVEDGGFIFFDDCGVSAPSRSITKLFLAQLRQVMPEYGVDRIPNDHEIYNNYYNMGGPPTGFDIFWWGTHAPRRNFLEGINIGDKLGVLVCERDYMCSMESVSLPTRAVTYSPGVYRFCTNVVVYALTHGVISDYSHYVPEDRVVD